MTKESSVVMTGKVRFSFVNVFEVYKPKTGEGKYQLTLIISKKDKGTVNAIKAAIEFATENGSDILKGKKPKYQPLRDGDEDESTRPEYENAYFLCAKSINRPIVFDENGDEMMDKSEIYSGCYGKVKINFFAYNYEGKPGIGAGLVALKKTEDGERLSGISATSDEFDDEV